MKKILVANRGEIAVRVLRAAREMGIPTVATYSEADREALHVQLADEAACIGPPAPLESYLNIDAIIAAATSQGADAIHPGYGFLAENAEFAARCEAEGITFIGPTADAIRIMGDKVESRRRMAEAGVPITPGTEGATDVDEVLASAKSMDLPVMVKAAGGGGGKGMRIVRDASELADAIRTSSREAQSAFGNPMVYVEKYVESPRHIEFQVLADNHGNTVHLFERECSIQRRHQKLVEETPSVALDSKLRAKMGEAAVTVAKAVDYQNAGTVEFLFDKDRNFYFLEMNTRVQVEHPVTEFVTGVDLVKWQIRIASGEKLTLKQKDLSQRGHSIECRIYAEDAENNFMPSSGVIRLLREPMGPGIRVDSGIFEGFEVATHYDPILSKLIVWGEDREAARVRMIAALEDYICLGINAPVGYLRDIMRHDAFIKGETDTDFLPDHFSEWTVARSRPEGGEGSQLCSEEGDGAVPDAVLIGAAIADSLSTVAPAGPGRRTAQPSPWQTLGAWRLGGG